MHLSSCRPSAQNTDGHFQHISDSTLLAVTFSPTQLLHFCLLFLRVLHAVTIHETVQLSTAVCEAHNTHLLSDLFRPSLNICCYITLAFDCPIHIANASPSFHALHLSRFLR
jgi:hypothetical protein